ncbi:MAG: hypothetical protein E6J91_44135 [Deltaproteobacteria bacterium]|nr:MAG: hypothetical protein E6J91_44135 [Deltaproteobacteria bacterium]
MEAVGGWCTDCGKPIRAGAVLYTAEARPVCPMCFTRADVSVRRRAVFEGWSTALIGAIANAIPLVIDAMGAWMVAPAVASAGRRDWVALVSGVVAAFCGGATVLEARSRISGRWLVIGALVALLGVYHAVRGAGLAW